ncbi:MAG: phosphoribosyl-AMP cyclohydrolase [Devosiaceae bacterium]|nr:phosphoribosyl-AMP cyclohydrolase [Devosiaceae bacterium MH13]
MCSSPSKHEQEFGTSLNLRFDPNGLVTAVTTSHSTGRVLMVAHMNQEAVDQTLATGFAHYWSRSRQSLWCKGETSGERQKIIAVRVDCDQDAVLLEVEPEGHGTACHNGFESCFYRTVSSGPDGAILETVDTPKVSVATLYGTGNEGDA